TEFIGQYIEELEKLKSKILELKKIELQADAMRDIYDYVKSISPNFYDEQSGQHADYSEILFEVQSAQDMIPNYFISHIPPYKPKGFFLPDFSEPEEIMDFLVEETREYIYNKLLRHEDIPFHYAFLEGHCYKSATYISKLCQRIKVKQMKIKIEPGFKKHSPLYDGRGWHYFNIVIIDGRYFLIDCTYSQFFILKRCMKESIGIMDHPGASAGAFMQTGISKKVSDCILKHGWIELDGDILKAYLDGFAVSYRNGLYYEETGDFSYTTWYSPLDYEKFLKHKDNQLNHEKNTHLGFQYRPIKDSSMKF
ncbi:MAG TPA: hypothetical protein DCY94_05130, partial [Firmicutes bacterium]|nr:hypothetical protein [Bacillota bacterium]